MNKYKSLLTRAKKIKDSLKRKLYFIGILTRALEKEAIKPVVVGGFALEFYSTGGYATGDIDLVFPDSELIGRHLSEWGFKQEGRHWIHADFDLYIEVPGSSLSEEKKQRVTLLELEGLSIYLIGIEDLILDRLNAFVHWKSTDDGYWAKELLYIYMNSLDMEYIKDRSIQDRTSAAFENLIREAESLKNEKI